MKMQVFWNMQYFASVQSESEEGAGLYIVPSDTEAPRLLERLAKEGQKRDVERLENAKERLRQRLI